MAQSTYCRACSQHFVIGTVAASDQTENEAEEPGLWEKLAGLFRDNTPRSVACFDCGARQEVVRTATSCSCKTCGAYIDLQDFKIVNGFSRTIQTAGSILITPKGDLNSAKAVCGAADLRGPMRGNLICTGEVAVKFKGRITGALESDTLHILKKSLTEFVRPVRAREVRIEGEMSGRILASGTVYIAKSGRMSGAIFARGINIERGGVFQGELNIGEPQVEQPSQLPQPKAPKSNQPNQPKLPKPPDRNDRNDRNDPQSQLGLGLT